MIETMKGLPKVAVGHGDHVQRIGGQRHQESVHIVRVDDRGPPVVRHVGVGEVDLGRVGAVA